MRYNTVPTTTTIISSSSSSSSKTVVATAATKLTPIIVGEKVTVELGVIVRLGVTVRESDSYECTCTLHVSVPKLLVIKIPGVVVT